MAELTREERELLIMDNKTIFNKCKSALIRSGISENMICKIASDERFIPQKQQLGLYIEPVK